MEGIFGAKPPLPGQFTSDSPILALLREPSYEIAGVPRVETYRGVVDDERDPSPPRQRDLESIVFGTRQSESHWRLRRLRLRGPTPPEVWHVDIENERHCARFRSFTIAQHHDNRLFAFETETGKTVWNESCAASLFARPTLIGESVVRCGLSDGSVIDVDFDSCTTVARHRPGRAGALRAGAPLPPKTFHTLTKLSLAGIDYWLRDSVLWSSSARVAEVDVYRPTQFVFATATDVLVGLARSTGADHLLAVGFLDPASLQPRAVVPVGSSDSLAFASATSVDEFVIVSANTLVEGGVRLPATIIIDTRTRAIAACLIDHRAATLSGVWDVEGALVYRGKV